MTHLYLSLRLLYVLSFLACLALALQNYLSYSSFLASLPKMYSEMRATLDMNYHEAQINLYADRIWSIENFNLKKSYLKYRPYLQHHLTQLSSTYKDLVTATK
jgi:hypothetical protein